MKTITSLIKFFRGIRLSNSEFRLVDNFLTNLKILILTLSIVVLLSIFIYFFMSFDFKRSPNSENEIYEIGNP